MHCLISVQKLLVKCVIVSANLLCINKEMRKCCLSSVFFIFSLSSNDKQSKVKENLIHKDCRNQHQFLCVDLYRLTDFKLSLLRELHVMIMYVYSLRGVILQIIFLAIIDICYSLQCKCLLQRHRTCGVELQSYYKLSWVNPTWY